MVRSESSSRSCSFPPSADAEAFELFLCQTWGCATRRARESFRSALVGARARRRRPPGGRTWGPSGALPPRGGCFGWAGRYSLAFFLLSLPACVARESVPLVAKSAPPRGRLFAFEAQGARASNSGPFFWRSEIARHMEIRGSSQFTANGARR